MMKNDLDAVSFRDLEWSCELNFKKYSNYWHLYTDGRDADIMFRSAEDMKAGMNIIGLCCLYFPDIKAFTFELMNNHLHMILAGDRKRCEALFDMIKGRLAKYFTRNGIIVDMHKFNCELIEITSLQSLRNEIIYVNRNGYVARPDCTPFSYMWGAGAWFFNPILSHLPYVRFEDMTVREKRQICRSNDVTAPTGDIKVFDGMILPACFCDIEAAESFFRNAHHYFQQLTRKYEAYGEIASRLHETIFIADEEMYSAVCMLCMKLYDVKNPAQLTPKDRIEVARKMKQDYNASNRQIKSILKLNKDTIDQLFPPDA